MARLFDEMRREGGFCVHPWWSSFHSAEETENLSRWITANIHQYPPPVFVVDDINRQLNTPEATRYYFDQPITPPYPICFFEYRTLSGREINGAFVTILPDEQGGSLLVVLAAKHYKNTIVAPLFILSFFLDEQGIPKEHGGGLGRLTAFDLTNKTRGQWGDFSSAYVAPILSALALLNCRNIQTPKKIHDAPLNKKWLRKSTYPLVEYHTLKLQLPATRNNHTDSTDPGTTGNHKRLHMARGHFAHYGPEGKLFGRLEGTFWVPAHLKGNKEKGILLKNYSIESTKGE